jgi:hypothetical protein
MDVNDNPRARPGLLAKPGAWVDLGLTLPIFLVYHLGVVFLNVRNGTDLLTGELLQFAEGSRGLYLLFTAAIGVVFAGIFAWLGRGQAFAPEKFIQIAVEGTAYAFVMRLGAAYVVGRLFAGQFKADGAFVGGVMSMGAGFYEELTFRVLLFGLGAKTLVWTFAGEKLGLTGKSVLHRFRSFVLMGFWSLVSAAVFSGVHYIGPLGDSFQLTSFTFRFLLGLALTLIYVTRGFAAAVWAHALYDLGVLVL